MNPRQISRLGVIARLAKLKDKAYATKFSKKCALAQLKRHKDPEARRKHREACLAAISKPSWLKNVRKANSRVHPNNHFLTKEAAKRSSERMKKLWSTPEGRQLLKKGEFTPLEVRRRLAEIQASRITKQASPNKSELRLNKLLKKYFPDCFSLNVKNGRSLGGKVPDFIDEHEKLVVEMFGTFWHGEKRVGHSRRVEEARRRAHFKAMGYSCVIVWQDELENEGKVIKRIIRALTCAR